MVWGRPARILGPMTIESGEAELPLRFDVRRHLAHVLGGERADFHLVRGPLGAYRGLEADYSYGGKRMAVVLITDPLSSMLAHGRVRRITVRTPTDLVHGTLEVTDRIDW
jgi:hypothetical protein